MGIKPSFHRQSVGYFRNSISRPNSSTQLCVVVDSEAYLVLDTVNVIGQNAVVIWPSDFVH